MRIISQYGSYDLPYEQTELFASVKTIYADSVSVEDTVMAIYSSEEKAIKAMKMCREQYSQCEFNKLVIPKTDENLAKVSISLTGNAVNQIAEKYVFQFPADEEI